MNPAYLLSLLPFLACPLGMGLMMWLMMRMNKDQAPPATRGTARPSGVAGPRTDDELGVLRAHLRDVEAQQTALAAQLSQLGEAERPTAAPAVRDAAALTR